MRRKRGAIRSTSLSSPRPQSTASSVAAMTMPSMAAQITLKTSAVVLGPARGQAPRTERIFEALASILLPPAFARAGLIDTGAQLQYPHLTRQQQYFEK